MRGSEPFAQAKPQYAVKDWYRIALPRPRPRSPGGRSAETGSFAVWSANQPWFSKREARSNETLCGSIKTGNLGQFKTRSPKSNDVQHRGVPSDVEHSPCFWSNCDGWVRFVWRSTFCRATH